MKRKEKGFTLIELIASVAIFTIISIVTISMLSFAFKYNSINRKTYEADTNSKILFESLKKESNRINVSARVPGVGATPAPRVPSVPNGTYVIAFDEGSHNTSGIDALVLDKFINAPRNIVALDPSTNIAGVMSDVKTRFPSNKYAIVIKSTWDDVNELFIIETWSWDLNKGEISMINRKTLIGPKI